MNTPLVSIIIPTYNSANLITDTLTSVENQSYANWECVVVDDGSSDETLNVLKKYALGDNRLKIYERPTNKLKGPSSCRNIGLDYSKGEFIIFLDSDDLLAPYCLEKRIKFYNANKTGDLWLFTMQSFIGNLKNLHHKYGYFSSDVDIEFYEREFKRGYHPFVITCPLWRKSVLLSLKGFNEQLELQTDPELHLRAIKERFTIINSNSKTPDCFYRVYENNQFKHDVNRVLNNHYIVLKEHLDRSDDNTIFYFKRLFIDVILKNKKFNQFVKYLNLGRKKGICSTKSFLIGFLLLIYYFLSLEDVKGLGFYKIRTMFNKSFYN